MIFLQEIFKEDESISAFNHYKELLELENYMRPADMSITIFCSEFQKRSLKVKAGGTTLSESVLALKLLKAANLSKNEEQIVRATISTMDSDNMTKQLKKVVGCTFSNLHSDTSTISDVPSVIMLGQNGKYHRKIIIQEVNKRKV